MTIMPRTMARVEEILPAADVGASVEGAPVGAGAVSGRMTVSVDEMLGNKVNNNLDVRKRLQFG